MTKQHLTARQRQVYDFIVTRSDAGRMPTFREIGEHLGITSTNGVSDHLNALERKGWIDRTPLKSRAITLVSDWPEAVVKSEPARVYTFGSASEACDWWDDLGPEFEAYEIEGASIVVTRAKR